MIRIGICGYGNLGKGVEKAIKYNPDMELVGIFSRRDISSFKLSLKVIRIPVTFIKTAFLLESSSISNLL